MKLLSCLVIVGTLSALCSAKYFPNFLKKCSESDSHFNQCIADQINAYIPKLGAGDKQSHIPPLAKFLFNKVSAQIGDMHLDLIDGQVYGIDKIVVTSAALDKKSKTLTIEGSTPELILKSKYTTKGKLLILPIEGQGDFEGALSDIDFTYTAQLDNLNMETKERMKYVNSNIDYTYKNAKFRLDNLFNGNKKLGDPVMKLINEEHQQINKEFKPVFVETIKGLISSVIEPALKTYAYSDVVLP